jgi:hypothetical protein
MHKRNKKQKNLVLHFMTQVEKTHPEQNNQAILIKDSKGKCETWCG